MMNQSKTLFQYLVSNIKIYDTNEAKAIVYLLLDELLGISKTAILLDKPIDNHDIDWEKILIDINQARPVQHIIGHTEFYGRTFKVSPAVLIPRPETEELIEYFVREVKNKQKLPKILDIGTGSGCIAISLAKEIPAAEVHALDISAEALAIAQENAQRNEANVRFHQVDILSNNSLESLQFDIIVSNPPYITQQEATEMQANVLDFEPHLALFVENDTPLLFYRAILDFAQKSLQANGFVFVEINENFGNETAALFKQYGYQDIKIIKDLFNKNRFVCGWKAMGF